MDERDDKAETQKQWNTDPCGAETAAEHEPGTPAFFRKIDTERYDSTRPGCATRIGFEGFAGKKVLEIGPGLGTDHAQFARAGAKMFALDLTRRHLELTRRRFEIEGLVTRLVRGDAERLPLADGSFDVVYAFGVLHHTPDDRTGPSTRSAACCGPGGWPSWACTTATRPSTGSTPCSGAGSGSASCGARATCACSRTSSIDPRARRRYPSSRS